MQSSSHMGSWGLLSLFLILTWVTQGSPDCLDDVSRDVVEVMSSAHKRVILGIRQVVGG